MTKLLAFSDLHLSRSRAADIVRASTEADLVICAGDFCNHRKGLAEAFAMLGGINAPFVAIPGNAESAAELRAAAESTITVLHGDSVTLNGLTIFGLGYAVPETPFGEWSCDLSEQQATQMLADCKKADILVTHAPPKGLADVTSAGVSLGSTAIRDAIERVQPPLCIFGHIHDSWGQEGLIGATRCVNLGPTPNWFGLP